MAAENILSCRVFYFEHQHDRFRRPGDYPALASVSASTHDLPTLRGFWNGDDIAAKAQLGTFKSEEEESAVRNTRSNDRRLLLETLAGEGLLPERWSSPDVDILDWTPRLTRAVHTYLGRTPSRLFMVQLDDLANELNQANLPGSTTQYPNWRRRSSGPLSDVLNDPAVEDQMVALNLSRRDGQINMRDAKEN